MFRSRASRSVASIILFVVIPTSFAVSQTIPNTEQELFRLSPAELEQLNTPLALKRLIEVRWIAVHSLDNHLHVSRSRALELVRQKHAIPTDQHVRHQQRIDDALQVVDLLTREVELAFAELNRIMHLEAQRLRLEDQEDDAVTAYRKKIGEIKE